MRERSPPANSERVFLSQDATCIGKLLCSKSVNTFPHQHLNFPREYAHQSLAQSLCGTCCHPYKRLKHYSSQCLLHFINRMVSIFSSQHNLGAVWADHAATAWLSLYLLIPTAGSWEQGPVRHNIPNAPPLKVLWVGAWTVEKGKLGSPPPKGALFPPCCISGSFDTPTPQLLALILYKLLR